MHEIHPIPSQFNELVTLVQVIESTEDDTISYIVEIGASCSAGQRGKLLMNLEDALCILEPRIRVWHVPLGDKNSLRNLRGIKLD